MSLVDLEERKAKYAGGIKKPRKVNKLERNVCGIAVPAEMDGDITIKNIQKKYSWIWHSVHARNKSIPEQNGRTTTIPRSPLKGSLRGKSKSAWYIF